MKNGKLKTFGKVAVALAVVDLIDVCAKGHMLYWLKSAHPEAANDWLDLSDSKLPSIRPNMINKVSDILIEAFG